MYEFRIRGNVIGHSSLEKGDAPMGVAFGEFIPLHGYRGFLSTPTHSEPSFLIWEGISLYNNDQEITCTMGVALHEYDLGEEGKLLQINCHGISYPQYE